MNWYKKIIKLEWNYSGAPTPTPPFAAVNEIDFWLTKGDKLVKLEKQLSIRCRNRCSLCMRIYKLSLVLNCATAEI